VSSDSPRSTCESSRSILHEASWQFWRMSPAKYRISLMRSASVAMRTSKHSIRLSNKLIAKLVPYLRHPGFRGIQIKVISEIAGHADVRITLSVYAHVLPDMQDAAADSIDDALGDDL
jgi:integrase